MRSTALLATALAFLVGGCGLGLRGATRPSLSVAKGAEEGWLEVRDVGLTWQRSRSDCGAAALTSVLAHWRPASTEAEVRAALGPIDEKQGLSAGRLRTVARAQGLEAFIVEGTFEDLVREIAERRPVIAGVVNTSGRYAYPHYEVVVGVNRRARKVLTADPARGWREQPFATFEERWKLSRHLLLVILPPAH